MRRADPRVLGLLAVLLAVVLLAAVTATWSHLVVAEPFGDDIVMDRVESVDGTDLVGGAVTTALLSLAVAGVMIRWPRAGWLLALLGMASLIVVLLGWPDRGSPTAAPTLAAAAATGQVALGAFAATARRPDSDPATTRSRYTVEAAAAGRTAADDHTDEWDAALSEDTEET